MNEKGAIARKEESVKLIGNECERERAITSEKEQVRALESNQKRWQASADEKEACASKRVNVQARGEGSRAKGRLYKERERV